MKPATKWIALAAAVLLVVGAARVWSSRKAQQDASAMAAVAKAESIVELAATDVVVAQSRELTQGLPLSGSVRAANSAFVKARVAGELQALSVREGDSVKAGQTIARVDPTEYQARWKQAQEQASAAKAQIDIAQRQFDNNKALVDQGFISRTALDTSQASLQSAQATYQAARAALDVAQKALDDTTLVAPISGQIAQRLTQPGERVAVDAKVVEIVDLGRMELEAVLSASDAGAVRIGQDASLNVEGIAAPVAAKVVRVNPSTQAGSRSVLIYLAVQPTPGLRQGLFAQGALQAGRVTTLAVPLTAVRTDKPEPYVQVVENSVIVHRAVKPGAQGQSQGETLVGLSGLAPNATVVRGTVGPLRAGTTVKFTAAPAPASASPSKAGT